MSAVSPHVISVVRFFSLVYGKQVELKNFSQLFGFSLKIKLTENEQRKEISPALKFSAMNKDSVSWKLRENDALSSGDSSLIQTVLKVKQSLVKTKLCEDKRRELKDFYFLETWRKRNGLKWTKIGFLKVILKTNGLLKTKTNRTNHWTRGKNSFSFKTYLVNSKLSVVGFCPRQLNRSVFLDCLRGNSEARNF